MEESEQFEIVLVTGYHEEFVDGDDNFRPEFLDSIRSDAREILESDVQTEDTGYGYGADTLALALMFSTLTAVFLAGKSIQENVDAWINLGRRFLVLLKRLSRVNTPRISEPIALAIAMAAIAEREQEVAPIGLVSRATTRVRNGSLVEEAQRHFNTHPDRYYVFTIELLERNTHVIAVSSLGEILFHHKLSLSWPKFLKLDSEPGDI
jgi:hypothetical protein